MSKNLEEKKVFDWLAKLDDQGLRHVYENLKHFGKQHMNPRKRRRKSQFVGTREQVARTVRRTLQDSRRRRPGTLLAQSNSRSERALILADIGAIIGHDIDSTACNWCAVVIGDDRHNPGQPCIFTSFPTTEDYAMSRIPIGAQEPLLQALQKGAQPPKPGANRLAPSRLTRKK